MGLCAIAVATFSLALLPKFAIASESGTGGCMPHTWDNPSQPTPVGSPRPGPPRATPAVPRRKTLEAGDVNCRYEGRTYDEVDTSTCQVLADRYGIDIGKFYELNPILEADCSRIKPNTEYCVTGCMCPFPCLSPQLLIRLIVIEPLRAYDGFCGPFFNNATCLYTGQECCSRETWTCGNSG